MPARLGPFLGDGRSRSHPLAKAGRDELVETYSIYGFFPGIYEMVYLADTPAEIALTAAPEDG